MTPAVALVLGVAACGDDNEPAKGPPPKVSSRPAPAAPPSTPPASSGPDGSNGVELVKVGDFESPDYLTAPPGDSKRIFVVEQGGTIRVVQDGRVLSEPFLDITSDVKSGGEQGLLSMAFAPDYSKTGRFYVDYTDQDGNSRIEEFRVSRSSPDVADKSSRRLVLFQRQPEPNHNGGSLVFGPDGLLYIGFGDGGGGGDQHGSIGNGQNLDTLLGKILRIDPRQDGSRPYSIPPDNPFVGRSDARPEVYSYGLRNPWRFSFDRASGDLSIGDVGQDEQEEIDFVAKGKGSGANFGWRVFEGDKQYTPGEEAKGAIKPVIVHTHEEGWCSITGGYVIRAPDLRALAGRYIYGDFCLGKLYSAQLRPDGASDDTALGPTVPNLSSFGEDALGRVYAVSLDGPVYRLAPR